ncbi:MAG TPA: SDR family oxidoreductase [Acidimicrobiales bacterium]|nr:SDR family oxidoreductase [Acidimicrobiales bacterium]
MGAALITGASRGLGRALALSLAGDGWSLVVDGRDPVALTAAAEELRSAGAVEVRAVPGDVADPAHRRALAREVGEVGGLDVLVNNAGTLGPSPLPPLAAFPLDALCEILDVNVTAQLGLVQETLPMLRRARGRILNITSDAAAEAYEGWGGYGASKAALEQLSAVLGVEEPDVRVYAVDPGDMRTRMHQDAFPGEDISDRPPPETAVPGLRRLIDGNLPSGRYRVSELEPETVAGGAR